MTHFLWVEDFKASETKREENIISSTIDLVFGSIVENQDFTKGDEYHARRLLEKQGIFLRHNLLDALEFIHNPNELAKIDFIVLDVDMPLQRPEQQDKNNYLPDLIKKYQSEAELKKIAGYQIYIDLVIDLGFPKSHILFCSNHAGYFDEFTKKFKDSNIKFPPLYEKEHKKDIENWLTTAQSDYFVLRRGIIEACKELKKPEYKLRFDKFCKEGKNAFLDVDDYLSTLEGFLPLREPIDKKTIFKLFIRTLSHEWEESVEPKELDDKGSLAFSWIMKMTRNWIAHNSTAIFTDLTEQDIAYLFICNMRSMFDLDDKTQPYENHLLSLFKKVDDKNQDITLINGEKIKNKDIPLIEFYVSYFNERTNRTDVHNILHDLQNDKYKLKNKGDKFFITGLYHCFWFLTSSHDNKKDRANPNRNNPNQVFISRHYTFEFFNYEKTEFLFELARHIYNRSFSVEK